jgi:hypothetical protein
VVGHFFCLSGNLTWEIMDHIGYDSDGSVVKRFYIDYDGIRFSIPVTWLKKKLLLKTCGPWEDETPFKLQQPYTCMNYI